MRRIMILFCSTLILAACGSREKANEEALTEIPPATTATELAEVTPEPESPPIVQPEPPVEKKKHKQAKKKARKGTKRSKKS